MFAQIAASVLPSLVGGIFQSRENKKARKAAGIDYEKLRDDASAAGFNPLTALLAGGGQGYQRDFQPSLSAGSFISEAMQRGVDTYFDVRGQQQDQEVANLRKMLEKSQAAQAAAASQPPGDFGYNLQTVEPFRPAVSVGGPALRPEARPTPGSLTRIPAYAPNGNLVQLLPDVAERLGIGAFGNIMPGDWAELVGEIGELEVAADQVGVRGTQLNATLLGNPLPLGSTQGHPLRMPELPPVGSQQGQHWHNPGGFITGRGW